MSLEVMSQVYKANRSNVENEMARYSILEDILLVSTAYGLCMSMPDDSARLLDTENFSESLLPWKLALPIFSRITKAALDMIMRKTHMTHVIGENM